MERSPTPLQQFIEDLGLKVLEIVREANRIAVEERIESISRQHYLSGESVARSSGLALGESSVTTG